MFLPQKSSYPGSSAVRVEKFADQKIEKRTGRNLAMGALDFMHPRRCLWGLPCLGAARERGMKPHDAWPAGFFQHGGMWSRGHGRRGESWDNAPPVDSPSPPARSDRVLCLCPVVPTPMPPRCPSLRPSPKTDGIAVTFFIAFVAKRWRRRSRRSVSASSEPPLRPPVMPHPSVWPAIGSAVTRPTLA